MKLPYPASALIPRTSEGFRGAFFGLLLSVVLNETGTWTGLAVLVAFGVGMAFAPHFQRLEEQDDEGASPTSRVNRFFGHN